jgi:hypothetical protein
LRKNIADNVRQNVSTGFVNKCGKQLFLSMRKGFIHLFTKYRLFSPPV